MREDRDLDALMGGDNGQDELWLISYADLLTLLIGFFVLLVAVSPVKLSRFERLAASINGQKQAPLVNLQEKVDELIKKSKLEDRVMTREDAEGLGIELKDALLFDSGSAIIRPEGRAAIADVAKLVRELPGDRPVIIEGYTDEVPIATPQFRSNWELSSQRAINVLDALESAGVAHSRMSVRGHADTKPMATQGSVDQQRAANRRVVIRVE
ncbi:MAG TPA: OmpA family protein [Myxococcaceae bacterium]|nr:OmpA family protein [Myxococcaceae bacterium]